MQQKTEMDTPKDIKEKTRTPIHSMFSSLNELIRTVFKSFTGHDIENFSSFGNFVKWMHTPVDAAALGVFRVFYGIAMLIDIVEERGGSQLDLRFGEANHCHFPLINFIRPMSMPYMGIIYLIMWLGAMGITLGYKFKLACCMYIVPYWYIFLLDKPAWNNHSYLFGLCGILMTTTEANKYLSLDYRNVESKKRYVPYWNYYLIKFQFFVLYFLAGVKKFSIEWLSGYSMTNLGYHWVFAPFRVFLSVEMIELLVIHWFAAVFDLTIAFFMIFEKTRLLATPFMVSFHLMNSRLFTIGMFPWVCLAEVSLFFKIDWPRTLVSKFKSILPQKTTSSCCKSPLKGIDTKNTAVEDKRPEEGDHPKTTGKKDTNTSSANDSQKKASSNDSLIKFKIRTIVILIYCALQLFLPFSHFITKGYNNWTNGLYGYSWDMMVHSYDTILSSIKVVDNSSNKSHFLEPYAFTEYDRWTKYADMAVQYAKCIERNLLEDAPVNSRNPLSSNDISIYFDIWCSMNGRFQQRVFDPRVDLLRANWSPFKKTNWVLPVLNELNHLRPKLNDITNEVNTWSNYSDVLFVADFPQLTLDNFISSELNNVTLTVLDGSIEYKIDEHIEIIHSGKMINVKPGRIHHVTTIGNHIATYMYTFVNKTLNSSQLQMEPLTAMDKPILPLWKEFMDRTSNYMEFMKHVGNSILYLVYDVPLPLRVRERN